MIVDIGDVAAHLDGVPVRRRTRVAMSAQMNVRRDPGACVIRGNAADVDAPSPKTGNRTPSICTMW